MRRIPYTPFAADYWCRQQGLTMFFLSHLHTDHTSGLSNSWNLGTIYCSPISAALLRLKFPGISPSLIHPLEVGQTHLIPLDGQDGHHCMSVHLIDSNHCAGSVMFLWQGYFGNILYTGDFRYIPRLIDESPLASVNVDSLYLDNTYLNPMFDFCSQADAFHRLVETIEQLPDYRQYTVIVGVDSLGKERLLIDLARYFETVVDCNPARYAIIEVVDNAQGFSTVDGEILINVLQLFRCCQHYDNPPPYDCPSKPKGPRIILTLKKGIGKICGIVQRYQERTIGATKILGAVCTGWVCEAKQPSTSLRYRRKQKADYADVVKVPYSIHSNYNEIIEFVRRVQPVRVFPIDRGALNVSIAHLLGKEEQPGLTTVPEEVTRYHLELQRSMDHSKTQPPKRKRGRRLQITVTQDQSTLIRAETRRKLEEIENMTEEEVERMIVQCVDYYNSRQHQP